MDRGLAATSQADVSASAIARASGSKGRSDYAAIGTVTNLGARLCGEARTGQIVISQKVAAEVEKVVELEPLGALTLNGFHSLIRAHNIIGLE